MEEGREREGGRKKEGQREKRGHLVEAAEGAEVVVQSYLGTEFAGGDRGGQQHSLLSLFVIKFQISRSGSLTSTEILGMPSQYKC